MVDRDRAAIRAAALRWYDGGCPKAKNAKATFRNLIRYLRPYKWSFILAFILSIAGTVFSILGPKILGKATTKIIRGCPLTKYSKVPGASIDFAYIGRIALILLVLYLASAAFSYIAGLIMARVAMRVTYDLRKSHLRKNQQVTP